MLTTATIGMFIYGAYSVTWAVTDIVRGSQLEMWAEAGAIGLGLLLVLSAAFVRVRLPGGLALAIGAMLGLQALAVHSAAHMGTGLPAQIGLALVAAGLVSLAYFAADDQPPRP
jgi:hypothetical protein